MNNEKEFFCFECGRIFNKITTRNGFCYCNNCYIKQKIQLRQETKRIEKNRGDIKVCLTTIAKCDEITNKIKDEFDKKSQDTLSQEEFQVK